MNPDEYTLIIDDKEVKELITDTAYIAPDIYTINGMWFRAYSVQDAVEKWLESDKSALQITTVKKQLFNKIFMSLPGNQ